MYSSAAIPSIDEIGETWYKIQIPAYFMQHHNLYLQLQENLS